MLHYIGDHVAFFSIIIPTCNSASTISRCLASLLKQTYPRFEVLVIDGLSSDNTADIVRALMSSNSNIRLIRERDEGIYDAMNKGIRLAKGNWLYFLGSDDYLYNDFVLENVAGFIASQPKTLFVYGDVYTSDNYVQKFDGFTYDRLIHKNICHQAIFYHFSLFSKTLYDVKFKLLADWDFNLKVFDRKIQPVHTDLLISYYNMTGASANWLKADEYQKYFADKRAVYVDHRGFSAYIGYVFRLQLLTLKQLVRAWLRRAFRTSLDRTHLG